MLHGHEHMAVIKVTGVTIGAAEVVLSHHKLSKNPIFKAEMYTASITWWV